MCGNFYHWEFDDETDFRKLEINLFKTEFINEKDKFNNWNGEYKVCKKCCKRLPRSSYFFRIHPSNKKDGLHNTCKECQGNKFKWGNEKQNHFIEENHYYCVKCDTLYPLNEIYFVKDKNRKTGFSVRCKKCNTYPSEFGINRFLNSYVDVQNNFQVCLTCLLELPKSQEYYYKNSNTYETTCKKCQGSSYGITQWNRVLEIPNDKKYCVDCHEIKDIENFYIKNADSNIRYSRCKKCHYIYYQNRRHQQTNSEYSLEDWKFTLNYFDNQCAYCGIESKELEKEHIIPFSRGGLLSIENIIPSCKTCNCSKCDRPLDDFYKNKEFFTDERYKKIIKYMELFIC